MSHCILVMLSYLCFCGEKETVSQKGCCEDRREGSSPICNPTWLRLSDNTGNGFHRANKKASVYSTAGRGDRGRENVELRHMVTPVCGISWVESKGSSYLLVMKVQEQSWNAWPSPWAKTLKKNEAFIEKKKNRKKGWIVWSHHTPDNGIICPNLSGWRDLTSGLLSGGIVGCLEVKPELK